jgi:hypothetical protein
MIETTYRAHEQLTTALVGCIKMFEELTQARRAAKGVRL